MPQVNQLLKKMGFIIIILAVLIYGLAFSHFNSGQSFLHFVMPDYTLYYFPAVIMIFYGVIFGAIAGHIWNKRQIKIRYTRPLSEITATIKHFQKYSASSASKPNNNKLNAINMVFAEKEITVLCQELQKLHNWLDVTATKWSDEQSRLETNYNAQAQFLLISGQTLWHQLNHISQLTEIMAFGAGSLTATQYRTYCGEIKNITQQLGHLALSMSELSREQNQNFILYEEAINLNHLILEKIQKFDLDLQGSGIRLLVRIQHELPWLRADANRIRHIFRNLLENARKFTLPGGTIKLSVTENQVGKIEIRIEDDGIGLSDTDLERILFPDRVMDIQFAPPESHILLALAKRLVEAHGGRMVIDSQLGNGTKISVSLPNFRTVRIVYANPNSDMYHLSPNNLQNTDFRYASLEEITRIPPKSLHETNQAEFNLDILMPESGIAQQKNLTVESAI